MEKYTPTPPTKTQIACNAIRAMFFDRHYKGVVPIADLEVVKKSTQWHRNYTKKAIQQAVRELISEKYINLDEKKECWLWGLPETHEDLFPKEV